MTYAYPFCFFPIVTDGRLRSLQRQLNIYGFVMDGITYRHPRFYRGMSADELFMIRPRKPEEIAAKVYGSPPAAAPQQPKKARRSSIGSVNDDNLSVESLPNFAQSVHTMVEECKDPTIMYWSAGGKAFVIDPHHPAQSVGD